MLDQWVVFYIAGFVVTGLSVRGLKCFYRRTLLWPAYWVYLAVVFLEALQEEFARERH